MPRVIIAGGRDFKDYDLLKKRLDYFLQKQEVVEIVTGACKGADILGQRYGDERGFPVVNFPAEWDVYGKGAGFKRNSLMANYATHLVAFWNGESKGTKMMIDLAKSKGLNVRIVRYSI